MMDCRHIQKVLNARYNTHMYQLMNSYIFNGWECDFFSLSKSGYAYEFEIKISRSDFFKDFKKDKHIMFSKIYTGEKFYWQKCGLWYGDLIGYVQDLKLENVYRPWRRNKSQPVDPWEYSHQDYLNNFKNWELHGRTIPMYAPATRIKFIDLQKVQCPHRFYYVTPKGLLKKEEIPTYAGFIEVDGYSTTTIKEAPFLHKRGMDLNAILLNKFYYEAIELRQQLASLKRKQYDTES